MYHVVLKTKQMIHTCTKIILIRYRFDDIYGKTIPIIGCFDYICVSFGVEDKVSETYLYKNHFDDRLFWRAIVSRFQTYKF